MSGILVVAFLVHCGRSLLLCEEVDTRALAFRDMGVCREELGGIVAEQQRKRGAARVVMGKCRYLLVEPPRAPEIARGRAALCELCRSAGGGQRGGTWEMRRATAGDRDKAV